MRLLGLVLCVALLGGAVAGRSTAPPTATTPAAADVGGPTAGLGGDQAPLPETTVPRDAALAEDAAVPARRAVASWFGPGLYGARTACGITLTQDLLGVAHRSLPCGTPVTLRYGRTSVTVPVVDRGPFVAAREFDLTYATRVALGCTDLCSLSWVK